MKLENIIISYLLMALKKYELNFEDFFYCSLTGFPGNCPKENYPRLGLELAVGLGLGLEGNFPQGQLS